MDKKIGKKYKSLVLSAFICISSVFLNLYSDPHIITTITDLEGQQLQQVQINSPFLIQVSVVNDETNQLPNPEIQGLEQFTVLERSTQSSTIIENGKKTVSKTFMLVVKAGQEKVYSLGPVTARFDDKEQSVGPFEIIVSKEHKVAHYQKAFTEINFDTLQAYVGQKIQFSIRFYYSNNDVRLDQIKEPSFQGLTLSQLTGPQTGRQEREGIMYQYLEWTAAAYPEKPGLLTLDPVEATYSVNQKRKTRHGFFMDLADFFGSNKIVKRSFSNTLQLNIKSLPDHNPEVKAVGSFTGLHAQSNTTSAGQGEAIVVTLTLQGSGNFEQITHPILQLPAGLTYYESGSKINVLQERKTFEYIVQGLQSGDFIIDSQQFYYFNPEDGNYHVLNTQPLIVSIAALKTEQVQTTSHDNNYKQEESVMHIVTKGQLQKKVERCLPLWLFIMLLCLPALMILILYLKTYYQDYFRHYTQELHYRKAFTSARWSLSNARKKGYNVQVYHIIIDLFAARLKVDREFVTENFIEQMLQNSHLEHEKLIKWRLFFGHITEHAFSSYGTNIRDDGLFNQAAFWLHELEKIL